jgi:O-antigen/teichoic acid export membrane protein
MPEYFPWWKNFNLKTGFTNFGKSMILTINGFLDQMNTNGILFLIGKFLSPVAIPVFTTIRTVTNTMTILTNLTVQPLVPEMIRFQNEDQKEKIWKIIEVNWLVSGALISFSFLILVPIVEFLFDIWTKGQIEFNSILFYLLA